jgi:IclR family transcriptional regulator, KDG regulon repressor
MTVYRLTRTLEHMGFLALDPVGGEYRLGPAMLGARYLTGRYADLVRVARPYLEALAQKTGETVTLAVEIEKVSVAIDILRTSRPFMSEMDLGCVVGDTANTNGKLFAAYKPVAEKERLAAGPNRQWTPRTITEPSQLLEELEKVRREGVAFDIEERFLGTCAVGAPVRNQLGDLVAVMSVVVPTGRFGAEERKGHGEAVKAAAASLSAYLGFSPESA